MKTWGKSLIALLASVFLPPAVATAATLFVDVNSLDPEPPYTNWNIAATTIQNAIDAASDGDLILVNDGIYNTGGQLTIGEVTNRVAVTKPITVQSVNGAAVTTIEGYQLPDVTNGDEAMRCVYLTNGAALIGFTLTNGGTHATDWFSGDWYFNQSGGGVWCDTTNATISDCILINNSAGDAGAGAIGGTFSNCTFINNFAYDVGGGAYNSTLNHCTFAGNYADWGGGGSFIPSFINQGATVSDCVFTNNSCCYNGGGAMGGALQDCILINNFSDDSYYGESFGGGAMQCELDGCTLIGNFADYGGGAASSILQNCVVTNNSAINGGGLWGDSDDAVATDSIFIGNSANSGGGAFQADLNHCSLAQNVASNSGGGASHSDLNNCILTNNSAIFGGGVNSSTLAGCLISSNTSSSYGGGAFLCTVINCTVTANSGGVGGGISSCDVQNSIIFGNVNSIGNGNDYADNVSANGASSFVYSCATPLPNGFGNFTNDPAFVDFANGDFHLQTNSPCINSGNNNYNSLANDLDGVARVAGDTVDMGAYEFQSPASVISYAWLMQYDLPVDGSADFVDGDGDGMDNWQEWIAGSDPTNSASLLQMISAVPANDFSGVTVTWQSVAGKNYYIERCSDLCAQPAFSTIQTNVSGQSGTTSFLDTTAIGDGPFFYKVGVQQ